MVSRKYISDSSRTSQHLISLRCSYFLILQPRGWKLRQCQNIDVAYVGVPSGNRRNVHIVGCSGLVDANRAASNGHVIIRSQVNRESVRCVSLRTHSFTARGRTRDESTSYVIRTSTAVQILHILLDGVPIGAVVGIEQRPDKGANWRINGSFKIGRSCQLS